MRTPPKLAIPDSAELISDEVRKLLRAAEVGDRLPTPKSDILACAKLVEIGDLDLAGYELSRLGRLSDFLYRTFGKIRGFLDRRTEEIYVDPQLHQLKRTFVAYHEVTHQILPWQRLKFSYTEDDKVTLSSGCEKTFESEANYGAAEIMFQGDRFESEAKDFDLSISSALYLAGEYEASCHSSLRRFVERNHRPCLLLVLTSTTRVNPGGKTSYYVSHSIPSAAFTLQFGDPFDATFINPEDALGAVLNSGGNGEINLSNLNGFSLPCVVEVFTNRYRSFLMLYPKCVAHARKRVIRELRIVFPGVNPLQRFGSRP
jgi:hypothetical protein